MARTSWLGIALLWVGLTACGGAEVAPADGVEPDSAADSADEWTDSQGEGPSKDTIAPDGWPEVVPDTAPEQVPPGECDSDDDCDDGDACTADTCHEGACDHVPAFGWCHIEGACYRAGESHPDAPCLACLPLESDDDWSPDDSLACGSDDACARYGCRAGACVAISLTRCDDGDPCTDDACDPAAGCTTTPNQAPCDDGDVCTLGDACAAGACIPGSGSLDCDDGNPCTNDTCDAATGCKHFVNSEPCDDGDACTTNDRCDAGACRGVPAGGCDDGNPCTDDLCDPLLGCRHRDNAATCDDGDPCTLDDRCVGTFCVPGAQPLDCDDGNPCTDEGCVAGEGCVTTFNAAPCDDGDQCTEVDACQQGACVGVSTEACDDGNPCTEDSCDPATGCVFIDAIGTCDDGKVCTTYDVCQQGACVGQPLACDDGNACTVDACVEPTGCVALPSDDPACALTLTVDWPPRGVTLDPGALSGEVILVAGSVVSPADPAPTLTLNGAAVPLAPVADQPDRFAFAAPLPPVQALNLIELEATTDLGQVATRTQSFLYSNVWYPVTEADFDAAKVDNGVSVVLAQAFLDDDNPDVDDLASIISLIFAGLDLNGLLPNPVTTFEQSLLLATCRYNVNLNSVSFSGTDADLRILSNGLGLTIRANNLDVRFRLVKTSGNDLFCPGSQNGQATATSLVVSTRIQVTVVNGQITATVVDSATTATLNNLNVSLSGWLLDLLVGLFQGTLQSKFESAIKDAIAGQVQPLLANLFSILDLDLPFEIPSFLPGGSPVTIALRAKPTGVAFVENQSMTLSMAATAHAPPVAPYDTLGTAGYANCLASPFTGNQMDFGLLSPLDIGLFDDVLNALLAAVHEAGVLEMTLGPDVIPLDDLAAFGITDMNARVSGMLPPVVTACATTPSIVGVPGALVIEIGDLGIDAAFSLNGVPVSVELYASLIGAAALTVTTDATGATQVGVSILGFDTVKTDLVRVDSEDPSVADLVGSLIGSTLVPLLLDQFSFGDTLSFAMPALDLSNPEAGIPAGTALEIVPEAVERTTNANTLIKASVRQAAPVAP